MDYADRPAQTPYLHSETSNLQSKIILSPRRSRTKCHGTGRRGRYTSPEINLHLAQTGHRPGGSFREFEALEICGRVTSNGHRSEYATNITLATPNAVPSLPSKLLPHYPLRPREPMEMQSIIDYMWRSAVSDFGCQREGRLVAQCARFVRASTPLRVRICHKCSGFDLSTYGLQASDYYMAARDQRSKEH